MRRGLRPAAAGLALGLALATAPEARAQGVFVRGDCDGSLQLDITDAIASLAYLFLGGREPPCFDACDADDSEALDITDPIYILGYLFLGGPAPREPFAIEGTDSKGDALSCRNGREPPRELTVLPGELRLHGVGTSQALLVFALDAAGQLEDVTRSTSTTYSSDDPRTASVNGRGTVTAAAAGSTAVRVRYRAVTRSVPVRVLPAPGAGAPGVRITAPAGDSLVTSAQVPISGTVSDPRAALRLGSTPLENEGGFFQASASLELGANVLEVVAAGEGGEGRASVTVTRVEPGSAEAVGPDGKPLPVVRPPSTAAPDTRPPAIAVTSPAPGASLPSAVVEVAGTADEAGATVRVNGVLAAVDGLAFRARLRLPRGPSTLRIEATDAAGNSTRRDVPVTVDATLLAIAITEPPGPFAAAVPGAAVTVRGSVEPPGTPVAVNGVAAQVSGGTWSAALALPEGPSDVVATATLPGPTPRRAQAVRLVIVDRVPPEVTVAYPPEALLLAPGGYSTDAAALRFAGRVHDPWVPLGLEGLSLSVRGAAATVRGGTFSVEVPLAPGENEVRLVASDMRGNSTSRSLKVVRAAAAPPALVRTAGDGAALMAGQGMPVQLAVQSLGAAGTPQRGVPVVFEVVQGDGTLDGGARSRRVVTATDGKAAVFLFPGGHSGEGGLVVTARAPLHSSSPAGFVVSTTPASARVLAAHRRRAYAGPAGGLLPWPVEARLLDGLGNPVAGASVSMRVLEGPARLDDGASQRSVATDGAGIASVRMLLPAGDTSSVVEASHPGAVAVLFRVEGRAPGPAADTSIAGSVTDCRGQPVEGARVALAGIPGAEVVTGPAGSFRFDGAPSGEVLVRAEGSDGTSGASARVLAVQGRATRVEPPLVLAAAGLDADPGPRLRCADVSTERGAILSLPALPGVRLEVAPGSALFPGGGRSGTIVLAAPNLTALPAPAPDDIHVEAHIAVLPEGLRFDPPARLALPAPRLAAGRGVPLFHHHAAAGGFLELGGAAVDELGASAIAGGASGVREGGVFFAAPPGPTGGRTGTLTGRVLAAGPGLGEVPQREESHVLGFNVYAHSGELFLEETDLELPSPGRGLSFRFLRRYESRHGFQGSLGWGWEHEYEDRRLHPGLAPGNVVRATGRGRFDEYLLDASPGKHVSPPGVFAKLFADEAGFLVERQRDGTLYRYHPLDGSAAAGRLESIADRLGNRIALERDGRGLLVRARDSLGRTADYERFPDGRIASVTDFTGRKVTFGYDGAGNLTSVTSPAVLEDPAGATFPEGVRREYRYSSGFADERLNHNLTEVIDPREAASTRLPRVTIAYGEDPASTAFDRVVAQAIGGTNATGVAAGGTARFEYEGGGEPLDDASTAAGLESVLLAVAGLTRYTDPEGRVTEVLSSGAGLPLSVKLHTVEGLRPRDPTRLHPPPGVAPPFYETRFRWTREGLLASRMGPRGDRVDLAYDEGAPLRHAQAALLRREHHPAPQATAPGAPPAPPAVSLFKVDPLFAVAVEETAPGGGVTRRFLDYQEGAALEDLAREAGAEPADLEAALARAGVELGLGDLNGDGVTAQRRGNVVREVPPPATRPDGSVDASYSTFAYNELGQLTSTVDGSARAVRLEYHPAADPDGDGVPSAAEGQDAATGGFLARRIVDLGSAGENRGDLVLASYAYDPRGYLASAKDGNGNETFYFHDALGRLTEVRLAPPLRYRWHRVHDADGNVAAFRVENYTSTDRGGHFLVSANRFIDVEVDRDLLGRPVAVRREVSEGEVGPARSIERRYRYGPAGGLVRIVGPVTGRDEAFLLDERGLPLRRTLAAGTPDEAAVTTLRDEDGSVVLETDAADSDGDGQPETTEHHHDGFGRLAATIDPAGGTRVLERDVEGRVVAESFLGSPGGPTPRDRSGAGNVLLGRTCFRHDERGRLVERQRWLFGRDEPARALVETYHLDGAGRVEKRVDPDGGVWTWDHDGAGRMQRETDPLGGTLTVRYDGNGNPVREAREAFTLEPVGPAASGDPDYDEAGRFREVSVIVRAFDPLDRLTVLVDPAGGVWRMRYDSMSNRILVSDATGTPIRPETDPELAPLLDLLTEKQRSSLNDHGNRRRYVYDNLGRLVEAIHELRKEGRGGGEIDPTNPFNSDGRIAERFEWDDEGWLWAWTDDAGNRTELQRDGAGHPRTKVWPDGTAQSFETDRDGNPTAIADENGTVVRQRFDALGRLVERRIERAASVEGTTLQRFEHDGLSRVTLCFDDNRPEDPLDDALVCRRQDSLGGLLEEVQGTSSVEAGLDPASRVVSLRYPGGLRVETPRDRAGRIASLSDARRTFTAYRRFGSGLLLEKRLASGLTASFLRPDEAGVPRMRGYDPAGEVEEIAYRNAAGETMHGFEYGRDRSGHKLYEKLLHRLDGLGDAWQLDSAYRIFRYLPNVFDPRFPPVDPVEKLVYYADGNHSWRFLEVNFSVRRVEVNARSAYVSSDGDRFEYDARGSLRKAGELSFAYDALGRLARASRGTRDVALYRYDAARAEDPWAFLGKGRRVAKDVLQPVRGQPAGVVRFAYWGESVIEERDGAGQLLRQYLLEDDGRPAVLLDHVEAGPGKPYGLLHDACGSLTGIADPTGAVVETVRYGVHGQPRVFNSFGSPIQFSELGVALGFGGLQHDFELGFHLAGARHFDPSLARHLSEATPLTPRAPLEMNGYQLPGIPGLNGEVSGRESRRRAAPYLEPFRVRVGERAAPREPKLPAPPNTSPLTGS